MKIILIFAAKIIIQCRLNVNIAKFCHLDFRPLSENQVVQQVIQNRKYENTSVAEAMAQLCKKLAEKRVFGSKLMSTNTVAGSILVLKSNSSSKKILAPNHSSYRFFKPNKRFVAI